MPRKSTSAWVRAKPIPSCKTAELATTKLPLTQEVRQLVNPPSSGRLVCYVGLAEMSPIIPFSTNIQGIPFSQSGDSGLSYVSKEKGASFSAQNTGPVLGEATQGVTIFDPEFLGGGFPQEPLYWSQGAMTRQ